MVQSVGGCEQGVQQRGQRAVEASTTERLGMSHEEVSGEVIMQTLQEIWTRADPDQQFPQM